MHTNAWMLQQIDCFSPVMFSLMKIGMSLPFHLMCPHIPYFPLSRHLLFSFHVHHQSLCLRTSLHYQHRKVTPPLLPLPQVISLSLNPLYLRYHPHATHHPLICSPLPTSTLLHQILCPHYIIIPCSPMITRSMHNIFKPKQLNLVTKHPLPKTVEPSSVTQALSNPQWRTTMSSELTALMRHDT